jgi:hypothetical protein
MHCHGIWTYKQFLVLEPTGKFQKGSFKGLQPGTTQKYFLCILNDIFGANEYYFVCLPEALNKFHPIGYRPFTLRMVSTRVDYNLIASRIFGFG